MLAPFSEEGARRILLMAGDVLHDHHFAAVATYKIGGRNRGLRANVACEDQDRWRDAEHQRAAAALLRSIYAEPTRGAEELHTAIREFIDSYPGTPTIETLPAQQRAAAHLAIATEVAFYIYQRISEKPALFNNCNHVTSVDSGLIYLRVVQIINVDPDHNEKIFRCIRDNFLKKVFSNDTLTRKDFHKFLMECLAALGLGIP